MTIYFRAALAAAAALALSACATTYESAEKAPVAAEETVTAVVSDMAKDAVAVVETPVAEMPAAETEAPTQKENLLYGAMTKYELMSFVEAVNTAGLQSALEADTPMTVFAPNSQAFDYVSLPADADLAAILKGHIVPGSMDAAALQKAVSDNGAPVKMISAAGTELTVYVMDGKVKVAGPNGSLATVTQADMMQSNGVMHQISSVLLPK